MKSHRILPINYNFLSSFTLKCVCLIPDVERTFLHYSTCTIRSWENCRFVGVYFTSYQSGVRCIPKLWKLNANLIHSVSFHNLGSVPHNRYWLINHYFNWMPFQQLCIQQSKAEINIRESIGFVSSIQIFWVRPYFFIRSTEIRMESLFRTPRRSK